MGVLTDVCIGLLGLFAVADAVAHFTSYRYGETFSAWCWYLEARSGLTGVFFHGLLGVLIAVLWTHIEFRMP